MTFALDRSERLRVDGVEWQVSRRIGDDYQLIHPADGRLLNLTAAEIADRFFAGTLLRTATAAETVADGAPAPPQADFTNAGEKGGAEALRRRRYVGAILELFGAPPHTDGQIEIAVGETYFDDGSGLPPPGLRSMRRWIATQADAGFETVAPPSVFLPNVGRRQGTHAPAFPAKVEQLMDDVINNELLRRVPLSVVDAHAKLHGLITSENAVNPQLLLPIPSYETFWRRWNARDPALRMQHQLGQRAVRRTFGPVGEPRDVRWPNQIVEADHNWVACNLVDEDGIELGAGVLTLAIDIRTSLPTGFSLSFEPPSYASSMLCVRHAVKPKSYLATAFDGRIKAEWPCAGLPETLIIDNGPDFHSGAFKATLDKLGTTVIWAERASPWQRGHVERVFRTIDDMLAMRLPGAKLSGHKLPDDYDPATAAKITLKALNELLHMLFADVLPAMPWPWDQTKSRRQAWMADVSNYPLRLPRSLKEFEVFTLAKLNKSRKTRPPGVEAFGMYYDSRDLTALRRSGVKTVWVYYDPTDLSRIAVCPIDDDTRWAYADCKNGKYTKKLTLWQHNRVLDHLDPDDRRRANEEDLIAARNRLRERASELSGQKRRRRRKVRDHTRHTHRPVSPDALAVGEDQTFDEAFGPAEGDPLHDEGLAAEADDSVVGASEERDAPIPPDPTEEDPVSAGGAAEHPYGRAAAWGVANDTEDDEADIAAFAARFKPRSQQ